MNQAIVMKAAGKSNTFHVNRHVLLISAPDFDDKGKIRLFAGWFAVKTVSRKL